VRVTSRSFAQFSRKKTTVLCAELTLSRLRTHGATFVHGDVRVREDLLSIGAFDVLIECSAEPSVHAGHDGGADYVVSTNLIGTMNCLEAVSSRSR
jgi:CDP-paratose 2-epimerase